MAVLSDDRDYERTGDLVVRRIGRLLTMAEASASALTDAAVVVRNGLVEWVGPDRDLPPMSGPADAPELDAEGRCVTPGFVDAHTHLVWAGSRRAEFVARLAGAAYDGGGISDTAAATTAASDDELLELALARIAACVRNGTTTVEVKTGYGLQVDEELRLLGVLRRLRGRSAARVESTLLVHVVPRGTDRSEHVAAVIAAMPAARAAGARWCDVFCDVGAYSVAETRSILGAAAAAGLGLRMHAEQLARTGGARLAAELRCASADHLEHVSEMDARAMAASGTVAVLLPTATLTTHGGWAPVALLRDAGVPMALGTDCNPGTSWCESMPYVLQLACLGLGLSVDEAMWAATRGGAQALRRDDVGRLTVGARGDLVVLEAGHEADLIAHLGARAVQRTVVGGSAV